MGKLWSKIRRVWITLGLLAFVVFTSWSYLAFRPNAVARAALVSDGAVSVIRHEGHWTFRPRSPSASAGLVFFPGGMVDPVAYAPITRDVARRGFVAVLIEVPRRGAFGGADGSEVLVRARQAMKLIPEVGRWVIAGHSLGGAVASRMAYEQPAELSGLVLIGTSHPRKLDLAGTSLPVTRVFGTRDTIADLEALEKTRRNLPAATRMIAVEGGNHSQFGYYGFQPGDWPASITREIQQRVTHDALVDALRAAASMPSPPRGP